MAGPDRVVAELTEAGLAGGLLAGGYVVDLILALMVLEGLALVAYARLTGRGIAPLSVVVNLASGAALLLALRGVIAGWSTPAIAACLMASFAAHVADLAHRWR